MILCLVGSVGPEHSLCVHEWGLNLGVQVRIHCDWGTGRDNPIGAQRARSCSERQLKEEFPQWVRRGEERGGIQENSKREGKSQNWEIRAGGGGRSWTSVECGENHSRSKYPIKDGTHHWEQLMKKHLNCGSYPPPCISLSAQVTSPRRVHTSSWALHPGTLL